MNAFAFDDQKRSNQKWLFRTPLFCHLSFCLLLLLLSPFSCLSHAGEPLLERNEVFPPGLNGIARCRIPGIVVTTKGTYARATAFRLEAASLAATSGVTVGGAAVDEATGTLAPPTRTALLPPEKGVFVVNVPSASATVVELVAE